MINMENFARQIMDDHFNTGPFASEFDGIGMKYTGRPVTKRVSHPPTDLFCLLTHHSSYMHLVDGREARGRHFDRYGRNIAPIRLTRTWKSTPHVLTSSMTNCLIRP
jgi:hypothetical protein